MNDRPECKACGVTVRVREEDIERITAEYLLMHTATREAALEKASERMNRCRECAAFEYGTTCRHCGCLVAVLTRIEEKRCPHPDGARWE